MKKNMLLIGFLFLGIPAFSQTQNSFSYHKAETIESTSIVVISMDKQTKTGIYKDARLLFMNASDLTTSFLELNDPYYVTRLSVNNPLNYKGKKAVIFSAKTNEWSKIQKINENDPDALFICNEKGKEVQRISPFGFNVKSWSVIEKTNSIVMIGTEDTNGNKKFDKEDEDKILIFNLNLGSVQEVPVSENSFQEVISDNN